VVLQQRDPQAVMAILTADHFIGNVDNFHQLLQAAYEAAKEGNLVTLGITPTFPATGYGYIQQGRPKGSFRGLDVYEVVRFKEKPGEEQAEQMLAGGDHAWNSGMFVWQVSRIMAEFERQMPDLHRSLQRLAHALGQEQYPAVLEEVWAGLKSETIDYGIMEGARQVAVIPASDLKWSDVGSWDSLFDVLPADENGNIVVGSQHIAIESGSSLIYGTNPDRLLVTIGLSDLVVVDTGDVLLVCPKEKAQQVRQVVDHLKKNNPSFL
jgi:mannose-1-phosphate guanylyltransferase